MRTGLNLDWLMSLISTRHSTTERDIFLMVSILVFNYIHINMVTCCKQKVSHPSISSICHLQRTSGYKNRFFGIKIIDSNAKKVRLLRAPAQNIFFIVVSGIQCILVSLSLTRNTTRHMLYF